MRSERVVVHSGVYSLQLALFSFCISSEQFDPRILGFVPGEVFGDS